MRPNSANLFEELYHKAPVVIVESPGRINLIGEHIDYYGGYVMPAAIDKYITIMLGPSDQADSKVYSASYDEQIIIPASSVSDSSGNHWKKYILKILEILNESGFKTKPFNVVLMSTIPVGAGLSSSAALLCGFVSALAEFNGWMISLEKIALLAQTTEHRLGTPCGLMDQYASLMCKKDSFLLIDFAGLKIREIKVDLKEYILRLVNTKVHHELTDGGYARRRHEGESALEELKVFYSKSGSYREFNLSELETMPVFNEIEYKRAKHAITEHQRVIQFSEAVTESDFEHAGQLLYATHDSLKNDYEVSCEEADFIVEHAKIASVAGARIMGGGFGGCVLCLMHRDVESDFKKNLLPAYEKQFGLIPEFIDVNLGERSMVRLS
ncbi:MAG: galactokinase [Saprospiraceae bacterium]